MNRDIKRDSPNPEYWRLYRKQSALRGRMNLADGNDLKLLRKEYRKTLSERLRLRRNIPNPSWIKLDYVRYADDWLVGVWGPFNYVKDLKQQLKEFLEKLKLELSEEKTLITNLKKESAKFLGTLITLKAKLLSIRTHNVNGFKRRISPVRLAMNAPIKSLIQRLESNGFVQYVDTKKLRPLVLQSLTPLPTINLIIRYRSILNGYLNYYSFVDNKWKLKTLFTILKGSLKKAICYKEKISNDKFNKTYGKDITINITKKNGSHVKLDFQCPKLDFTPNKFLIKEFKDPLLAKIWKISSINPLDQACANCGDDRFIEMHHIKHIKTINPKLSSFDKSKNK